MILMAASTSGALRSILDLLLLLVIFAVILFLAYWTSKMAAKLQSNSIAKGNMEVVETMRLQNNKYVQIVKIADKYVAIGIGKDEITFLTEVDEEQLQKREVATNSDASFKDIIGGLMKSSNQSKGQDKS